MTTLNNNMVDIKYQLDVQNISNDVRFVFPHYAYRLDYTDPGNPVLMPVDGQIVSVDQDSIEKYGRRTNIIKFCMAGESYWADGCAHTLRRYKEPIPTANITITGSDATNVVDCLSAGISDQNTIILTDMGLNDTFWVDGYTLKVREDMVPTITMNLIEVRDYELLNLFIIDTDLIDSEAVIG
jgi:hypothetical protein